MPFDEFHGVRQLEYSFGHAPPPPPRLSRIDAFQEGDGPLRTSCVDELYTRLNFNRFYDQRAISPLW